MEYFDVVDENGLPTGQIVSRAQAHRDGTPHRTAHIWVVDRENGRVLLQMRSLKKDSYPGMYDTSSAGHIPAGEEPLEAAMRELSEELGIEASPEELTYIGQIRLVFEEVFHDTPFRENEYSQVYVYDRPVDISSLHLQESEVDAVRWFPFAEAHEKILHDRAHFCVPESGYALLERWLEKDAAGRD